MVAGILGLAAAQGKISVDGAVAAVSLRNRGGGAGNLTGTTAEDEKARRQGGKRENENA